MLRRSFSLRYTFQARLGFRRPVDLHWNRVQGHWSKGFATAKTNAPPAKSPPKSSSKFVQKGSPRNLKPPQGFHQNYAEQIIRKKEPLLLYERSKRSMYGFACWMTGGIFATLAVYASYLGFGDDLKENPMLKWLFRGLGFLYSAATTWSLLKTTRRIRAITAVPTNGRLLLHIRYPRFIELPRRGPVQMIVRPKDVRLQHPVADPRFETPLVSGRLQSGIERTRGTWGPYQFFYGCKRFITGENILHLRIAGKDGVWKLDRWDGLFADGGKALDKLVSHDWAA